MSTANVLLDMVDSVTWHEAKFEPDLWRHNIRAYVLAARSDLLAGNEQSSKIGLVADYSGQDDV